MEADVTYAWRTVRFIKRATWTFTSADRRLESPLDYSCLALSSHDGQLPGSGGFGRLEARDGRGSWLDSNRLRLDGHGTSSDLRNRICIGGTMVRSNRCASGIVDCCDHMEFRCKRARASTHSNRLCYGARCVGIGGRWVFSCGRESGSGMVSSRGAGIRYRTVQFGQQCGGDTLSGCCAVRGCKMGLARSVLALRNYWFCLDRLVGPPLSEIKPGDFER